MMISSMKILMPPPEKHLRNHTIEKSCWLAISGGLFFNMQIRDDNSDEDDSVMKEV